MIVSIITVNLNNKSGLEATIKSVVEQSYNNIDFIVIDGDSNDGSEELINQYVTKFSHSISEPDTGIYNAMNKGILKAKGDYILFLNSGDILENKDVIKTIATQLNGTDVVSGDILIEDKKGTHFAASNDEVVLDFFFNISLYHQATFIKRQLFLDFGLYNETFKIGGDYEFFIRIFYTKNCTYKHINMVISLFKTDGISNNSAYLEINSQEAKKAWLLNVTPRTYDVFREHYKLLNSDENYLKSRSGLFRFTTKLSKFIYSIRLFFYKKFRGKK